MNKLEFISRQFAKAETKKFEHYVVTRIWHLLNNSDVKIVTQQFVSRPNGRAMTDMYFPQIGVHIEVDEGFHKKQIDADKIREADIINATEHELFRVDVTKSVEDIHCAIDEIVSFIKIKVQNSTDFKPWDLDKEQNPQTYIEKGYIDLEDDVAFRTMVDAANCFGLNIKPKGIWTGGAKHPIEPNTLIWFPKLYQNNKWNNRISGDDEIITEKNESEDEAEKHIKSVIEKAPHTRITFAKVKSPLGDVMYRFKGKYQLDLEATSTNLGLVWKRIATRVKTYPSS